MPEESERASSSEPQSSGTQSYKKNYTYEDYLREQAEEAQHEARKSASPNLAVSSMPAFASLEDVLRYFLYEEAGLILDAGADKLESSLIIHNLESVAISKSMIALTTRKSDGFSGEVIVASITSLPFKENAFVRCVCSKGLEGLSNTIEVTNALVELSRACKTTIVTLRRYGDSIVHRVIFTRMFVDRLVKGVGIHYGILRREDGDFVIYLLSKGLQSQQSLAMEYAGESISQKLVGRAKAKQVERA
ncbi:MAG: class I SAM-dependent methyltransferase [Nitrososphaerota archaeon]|nr:class I SAM-dependent methyltransferase [Nitrososphaerota archaeon]